MHHEILDVVDEHDCYLRSERRAHIHAHHLRHRAVHILVFNDAGHLLLQKRSAAKDLNPGLWDSSAAGHVDSGESYADCALRELGEELGVCAPLTRLCKLDACTQLGMEFVEVFRCRHNGPFTLAAEEIDTVAWCAPEQIEQRVRQDDETLTTTFKWIWRQLHPIK